MTGPDFGAELFLGRLRTDLLTLPADAPLKLSAAEEEFLARLRRFCVTDVDGHLIERAGSIPDRVIERLKDLGALAIRIPREYGGLGFSGACYHRALMLVSSVHASLGELLAAHQAIGLPQPLALFGTEEQRRTFLPRCVREISAFTLTEPELGNDPFQVRTTAVRDLSSDTYTLNGVKLWATNGVIADLLVVLARVPESGEGPGGTTAFVVEADSPGVTVEHRSEFLGLRGLENGVIRLHDVTVPACHRIGAEGAGLDIALAAQETGRLSLPAVCAAAAKWSVKIAREWAGARVQGGRPIGAYDAVAGKLSFIAATAFALEAMVEITGHHADRRGTQVEAELAKLFASEQTWLVADELMQIRGGRGYETADSAVARGERGVPVERLLRDLRIGRIFDGSSEALRSYLAQAVLGRHRETEYREHVPRSGPEFTGRLGAHLRSARSSARRLAEQLRAFALHHDEASVDDRQRHLGRLIDIGAELYAMAASCVYATAHASGGEGAVELADAFCAQSGRRVEALFAQLTGNTDTGDRVVARRLLDERYVWLEEDVIDTSVEGPWIAIPAPGPATGPDLRRRVPKRRDPAAGGAVGARKGDQ
ncbi:acyl-CoA dehydrogenase family protein [Streptomyces lancefieldiae]|uniref:Acyl-CoA dehydrogenase family protein n=1 Tax=Streptomyces lancefieldiae TaxID=3075520 RepID=A0ABU3ARC9_9ACTN|nr:acyl-CoA dehydrogenase family protein [Streptomyces sp. DSM 40712]MDT0612761.1 acyl-CoA dehydrogenase family protein [Streptomyces sp. DSM 40712]